MGCGSSTSNPPSPEEAEAQKETKNSKDIEKVLYQQYEVENAKVKLLLLGAAESGKSTIFKQMRVLYGAPLTLDEKQRVTPVVYKNTIGSMKILCAEAEKMGYGRDVAAKESFDFMMGSEDQWEINDEIGLHIKELWADPTILKVWKRRSEFQIVESVKYYFTEIDRIMKDDYVATQQDHLLARVRTTGAVTEKYVLDDTNFEMYDVGGQRSERKKWIHIFDGVTAVIFVAALSEYDQVLFEDSKTNRMMEAVNLFKDICNNKAFDKSSMILFLNKKDLFEEKINEVHIGDQSAFAEFEGKPGDSDYYDQGINYFQELFLATNENETRQVYCHATCATDSKNVEVVFNSCKEIIMRNNIKDLGM